MKKLFALFLLITLVYSCSNSSDENGDTAEAPLPPTNLTGTVASTTQINLSWTDNSTNETGFKIERKTVTGTYAIVGTTATDVTTFNDTGLTPATTYTYRVYSNNAVGNSLNYSNELILTTTNIINPPTITTTPVSSITSISAGSGGNITNNGGANIIARGVCWSTSPNPTIALTTKTSDGTGSGIFTSNITGLITNTSYYVRAFATNSLGTSYGNEISFITSTSNTAINIVGPNVTDIDGNTYNSVTNCGITFTKQNLNVSKYTDGTLIPQVTDPTQWANLTTGAWCYYNNDSANGPVYGKLYNWYAVAGIYDAASAANPSLRKQLAPTGYHIPSNAEWSNLINCFDANAYGGEITNIAGGAMKETGLSHWANPNTIATNSSGFKGLPGGFRTNAGTFSNLGYTAFWWSSSEGTNIPPVAYTRNLNYNDGSCWSNIRYTKHGFSVRCIKD